MHRSAPSRNPLPLVLAATLLAALAAPVSAQSMKPLTPGLWQGDAKVSANGVDLLAAFDASKASVLQSMSPQTRAQVEAAMNAQGPASKPKLCVSAAQSAQFKDPAGWLAYLQRQQPKCSFQPGAAVTDGFNFTGRCNDPNGFNGTVQGRVTQPDAKQFQAQMTGHGTVAGLKSASDMAYEARYSGRWVSSDCGALAGDD